MGQFFRRVFRAARAHGPALILGALLLAGAFALGWQARGHRAQREAMDRLDSCTAGAQSALWDHWVHLRGYGANDALSYALVRSTAAAAQAQMDAARQGGSGAVRERLQCERPGVRYLEAVYLFVCAGPYLEAPYEGDVWTFLDTLDAVLSTPEGQAALTAAGAYGGQVIP